MPFLETFLAITGLSGTIVTLSSGGKDVRDLLKEKIDLESLLADLVEESFEFQLPRLRKLCFLEPPRFEKTRFLERLHNSRLEYTSIDDLKNALLPHLRESVSAPTAVSNDESEFDFVYGLILDNALNSLMRKAPQNIAACLTILLEQQQNLVSGQRNLQEQSTEIIKKLDRIDTEKLIEILESFSYKGLDKIDNVAPPEQISSDPEGNKNPFLLVRAEDFNHNYERIAKLFQDSPDWDSIQSRTENVFIAGGRGTGKTMLLRRLTAQTTVAARRIEQRDVTFDHLDVDYFGVYIKLTRGFYDQFRPSDELNAQRAGILAQHQLNIQILDTFADTLLWLKTQHALPQVANEHLAEIVQDLCSLFPKAPPVKHLEEIRNGIIKFEQDQILNFYSDVAFGRTVEYRGSFTETVQFIKDLSQIFRSRVSSQREIRLFLLIDEFESLLETQQIALNTVMKMRLPDVTLKIGVRRSGRKTADTYTPDDPIQQPRDYTEVRLDYDVQSTAYASLMEGIAARRLKEAGYKNTNIRTYLKSLGASEEVDGKRLEAKLEEIWRSGNRRNESMNEEFKTKYTLTAIYRLLTSPNQKKYCGFDMFVLLSSGITSNFIELCKYAFYHAIYDKIPLKDEPVIPPQLQSLAAHQVSKRLFKTIDGNVPLVGSILARLVADLGALLRLRLLNHSSEPEANRLTIVDYGELSSPEFQRVDDIIEKAIIWSVFHINVEGESFRPRNAARPPSSEIWINRIYCPVLGISPRTRWRIDITAADLKNLIDPNLRDQTYKILSKTIGVRKASGNMINPKPNKSNSNSLGTSSDKPSQPELFPEGGE